MSIESKYDDGVTLLHEFPKNIVFHLFEQSTFCTYLKKYILKKFYIDI